jgi:uncharacterized membrane protein YeaQ/YmgE (transglycosylase-associated protein family)
MPLILVAVVLLFLLGMAGVIWVTFGLVGLVLHLFMAGLVGALADAVVPGRLPWGWLGAVLAGLVGSWLGTHLIGHVGPSLFGISLLPGFVGAVILSFGLLAVGKLQARRS